MLYKFLFLAFFMMAGFARGAPCDPAVEICRVHPHSGELSPIPVHHGGSGGNREADACGVIGGDGTSCLGCDGRSYPNGGAPQLDACNVCGGDGTTCCGLGQCSGHGMCVDAKCSCKRGWAGPLCETPAVLCEGVDCGQESGRGECVTQSGECQCTEGWIGSSCQLRNCFPNGAFDEDNGQCLCLPGWKGDRCDVCADSPEGHTYVCTAPFKLHAIKSLDATVKLEHGLVWLPNSEHGDVFYDCACTPKRTAGSEDSSIGARALNIIQLENAFNEISRLAISRFISSQEDLDAAVEETQEFCDNQFAYGIRGTSLGVGVFVLTFIAIMIYFAGFVQFPEFGGLYVRKK